MESPSITAEELNAYRTKENLSLREMGLLLGGVSDSALHSWEKGNNIPAPAQLLLKWLIRGEVPFGRSEAGEKLLRSMWRVKMPLEAWEKLEAMRVAGGYSSVTDFIASLVDEELGSGQVREDSACGYRGIPGAETPKAAEEVNKRKEDPGSE